MGAEFFLHEAEAKSADEAYRDLCDEASRIYGEEPYNGTIATTCGFSLIGGKNHNPVTKTSLKKARREANKADREDSVEKRDCIAIDCGVVDYILRTISRSERSNV